MRNAVWLAADISILSSSETYIFLFFKFYFSLHIYSIHIFFACPFAIYFSLNLFSYARKSGVQGTVHKFWDILIPSHLVFFFNRAPITITVVFASNLMVEFLFISVLIVKYVLQLIPY